MEIVGLSLLGFAESNAVRYFGVFLTQAGSAVNLPAIITYQARNITGQWKRAFSSSIVVMFSGMGGIAGALIFRAQDGESLAPRVHKIIRFSQNSSSKLLSWALYLHWVGLKLTPFEETGKCLTRVRCNALLLSILGALSFFLRSANRRQQQGMLLIEKQVRMLWSWCSKYRAANWQKLRLVSDIRFKLFLASAAHLNEVHTCVSFVKGTNTPSESSQGSEGTEPYQNFSLVETQRDRRFAYKAVVFSDYCEPFCRGFWENTYWMKPGVVGWWRRKFLKLRQCIEILTQSWGWIFRNSLIKRYIFQLNRPSRRYYDIPKQTASQPADTCLSIINLHNLAPLINLHVRLLRTRLSRIRRVKNLTHLLQRFTSSLHKEEVNTSNLNTNPHNINHI